jgi:putative ABC transport system permease protein
MSTSLRERPAQTRADNGGVPARRAVIRWAWRLFRREWRQQLLVLALIMVAMAATVVGAAVATNTPPPANAGFGTAGDLATLQGSGPQLAAKIAALRHRFGRTDVIENQAIAIPGSISTYDLRAQNPRGPFGQPMLSLLAGHYPAGPGQVAVTDGVASAFNLKIGDLWHQGGKARRVVGMVENPQSLLSEFALVVPGQVSAPTQVTVLFDAPGIAPASLGPNVETPSSASSGNPLNPETIVLALATVGMLLIALVAVGGFTVLAQRRLRAIGMLGALGGTDKNIRLVVRANGVVVGVIGTLAGAALGLAAWLAYRPRLETSAHHVIGAFALPWAVIVPAMVLAVLATFFAASRPARSVTRIPIVTALSGRPAPPKRVHRSAVPGVISLVVAFVLLTYSGRSDGNGGGALELILGFVALIVAVILLSPLCLATLARLGRRAPIAVRLALRDLSRYRARSGSALAAISLGVLIAVVICVQSAARFGNVLDYAGPNLASNQLIVYTPNGNPGPGGPGSGSSGAVTGSKLRSMAARARGLAAALGAHDVIQLDTTSAALQHAAAGRSWSGPVYVATPALLRAFGIKASQVDPAASILTMRPGLSSLSKMQLDYGDQSSGFISPSSGPGGSGPPGGGGQGTVSCHPGNGCLANPVIQEVSALPAGTSAPNTVITEHAAGEFHLQVTTSGWLIQTPHPPTAAQINNARLTAAAAGMTVETRSSALSSAEILNWATVFGILLALGILAMTVGLIRSETVSDLRILAATGASGATRRNLTAATVGALALLGAVLGTAAGYVASIAFSWGNSLDGLGSLSNVPAKNLLIIGIGMPIVAAAASWLLAGREPQAIARRPLE